MAVPESKEELLKAINKNLSLLIKKLNSIPSSQVFKPSMEGHAKNTTMSVANLIAYLIGWGELVLEWHRKEKEGITIEFPETGYKWNQLGLLAQKFYKDYEYIDSYQELLEKLVTTNNKIVELINSYSNEQLYGQPWCKQWTRGRMIQFNTASPYKNATNRINVFLKNMDKNNT